MTYENTSTSGGIGGTSGRLDNIEAQLHRSVRSARTRNMITLVLAIISLALVAFYLTRAHREFTAWDADRVADYGQARFVAALPAAAQELKVSLREQAPSVIETGEQQLRQLPDRLAENLQQQVDQQLEARRPEAEEQLYQALKQAIAEADQKIAQAGGDAQNDEQRFRSMLDMIVEVYGTETSRLLDDVYARYNTGATDIISYLELLADGKDLTPQQQTQRTMIRNFLILARQHHANSTAARTGIIVDPVPTTAQGQGVAESSDTDQQPAQPNSAEPAGANLSAAPDSSAAEKDSTESRPEQEEAPAQTGASEGAEAKQ